MRDDATVLILGAGVAGGNAAVTLREEGWPGRIVLLSEEPGIPFGRPPLSKTYLRGDKDLSGWYVKLADWYPRNAVELRTTATIRRVDTAAKRVTLDGGESIAYDALVVCTGGRNRTFTVAGGGLRGVHQLRTLAECEAIRAAARPDARAVIVGMGFIGSEVAASLRMMGLEVTAVLSGTAPLAGVLGDEVAGAIAAIHRAHGVTLVTNDRVVAFEGAGRLERAVTAGGVRLECDLAVVGVGIEPAVEALAGSGIALENGVLTDPSCRTNVPDVYAAGDVANHLHPVFGRVRVEHYNNAEMQARAAARALVGDGRPYDYIHSFWSDQYQDSIEYVGFVRAWDRLVIRGDAVEAKFLAFYLVDGVMKAAFGLNRGGDPELDADSELRACQALIRARATLSEATLGDDEADLRDLAAATVG